MIDDHISDDRISDGTSVSDDRISDDHISDDWTAHLRPSRTPNASRGKDTYRRHQ